MAKKAGPPLYDVIRSGSLGRSPGATDDQESPRPAHVDIERDDYAVGNWLRPGRKVSVPAGYLFIAAALVLLLVIGGYMVGYGRGKHDEQLAFAEHLDPELADVARVLPRDPLEVSASGDRTAVRRADPVSTHAGPTPNRQLRTSQQWGEVRSDPRRPGLWYFILMTTNESGAVRLAEYCRDRGLEAYAVPSGGGRLWQVIALPGFESRAGPQAEAIREQIRRIGETWQRHERGATNLHDAYPERFGG